MENQTYGFIEDGKVVRKAFGEVVQKVIGEVKNTEEEAIQFFEEKFNALQSEVEEIAKKIEENTNKGSFLTKLELVKTSLPEFDGLGDFEALDKRLEGLIADLKLYIENNRHKNLQIKTALLEQLKPIAESHEWKTASVAIKEIQQKWLKTGAVAEDKREAIEGEFKTMVSKFYDRRNEFYADLNQMMADKEKDFEAFVEKATDLLKIESVSELREAIKVKNTEWKALGKIKPQKHSARWGQYQEVVKKALDSAKKLEKKRNAIPPKELLEKRKALVSQLEELNKELFPKANINQLKTDWKKLGKLAGDEAKELQEKFSYWLDMLSEKKFIAELVEKKKRPDEKDLSKLQVRVCRNLLDRDKQELANFEENLGKFNMKGSLDNMLTAKLRQQERKVDVKKAILKQFRETGV